MGEKAKEAGRGREEVDSDKQLWKHIPSCKAWKSRSGAVLSQTPMPSPQQSLPRAQSLARDSFLLTCEGSVIAKVLPSPISAKSLAFMAVTALGFQLAPILQRWGW